MPNVKKTTKDKAKPKREAQKNRGKKDGAGDVKSYGGGGSNRR